MLVETVGPITLPTAEQKKLTAVEVRPDGLVQLDRGTGWAVIDPDKVLAVVWNGDPENSPGQFL